MAARVPRLHVEPTAGPAVGRYPLPAARLHYLTRVLRLAAGAEVTVLDGNGHSGAARLVVDGRSGALDISTWRADTASESPLHTTLGLVLSRGQRMDYAIQKAVELGVSRIDLLTSEHCEVRARNARLDHWRDVCISALEQSGRTRLPPIAAACGLDDWLPGVATPARWLLHPGANPTPTPSANGAVAILSGPEGGFSDREVQAARAAGFEPVTLGPRTLRAETAPLVALALAQAQAGDLASTVG